MTSAVDYLIEKSRAADPYDYSFAEVREKQVEALDERFQSRKGQIKLLAHRAKQAGLEAINSLEDVAGLLFPHTAYKSYPESFLSEGKWDKLCKWLDTVSTYRVPVLDTARIDGVDDWIEQLAEQGFYVSCTSGTTGKPAMLVASKQDMEWAAEEVTLGLKWSTEINPAQDRRVFGLAPVASSHRNRFVGGGLIAPIHDPSTEPFSYPVPPITVGSLTQMVVLRKKIADGVATPSELQEYEDLSRSRQQAVEGAVDVSADAIIEARGQKLHISGMWATLYQVAAAVREKGYSAKDFNPDNSFYVAGGLKGAQLPDNYREFVYETFNIAPEHNYQMYSMQEIHSGMPRCLEGNRYHLPPWLVPLILDKSGDNLLPIVDDEYEGRAAFFDLSIDGRWGGIISGDKVSIDFRPCACGSRSPSIRSDIVRYSDLEGDDKIGCAGTVDAYVRGVS